jgi:hypothetical protein
MIMANENLIPSGRTSQLTKEGETLQIQTEFAGRPLPRLTTSVINQGQVIHKIQQELKSPIIDEVEKIKVEKLLQRQHAEVIRIVESKDFAVDRTFKDKPVIVNKNLTLAERLETLDGVQGLYRIDNEGNFEAPHLSRRFKSQFSLIFKNMLEILNIFTELPGGRRESGVVEIERRRLYLISSGHECYFLLYNGNLRPGEIEKQIGAILTVE